MQKVVYSVSKLNRFGNTKMTGVGFITDSDLITACVSKKGSAYSRIASKIAMLCPVVTASSRVHTMRSARSSLKRKIRAVRARDTTRERSKSSIPSGTRS